MRKSRNSILIAPLPPEYQNELFRSDVSIHPSYSRLGYAYFVTCRRRWFNDGFRYSNQFLKELRHQQNAQQLAYAGIRENREFSQRIRKIDTEKVEKLSKRERERVEYIMEHEIL